MKGLCYYNKIPDIQRSQQDTKEASSTFRELIARYKDTEYAKDAYKKLSFIDEHLAGSLMSTARYQMKNNNYIGAIYNLKEVIEVYRNSNQLPEAYYRLVEIYKKIGLKEQSRKLYQTLEKKFPQNYWTKLAKSI
jgi:outer membrane protein assembly factor BamD